MGAIAQVAIDEQEEFFSSFIDGISVDDWWASRGGHTLIRFRESLRKAYASHLSSEQADALWEESHNEFIWGNHPVGSDLHLLEEIYREFAKRDSNEEMRTVNDK